MKTTLVSYRCLDPFIPEFYLAKDMNHAACEFAKILAQYFLGKYALAFQVGKSLPSNGGTWYRFLIEKGGFSSRTIGLKITSF